MGVLAGIVAALTLSHPCGLLCDRGGDEGLGSVSDFGWGLPFPQRRPIEKMPHHHAKQVFAAPPMHSSVPSCQVVC